MANEAWMSAFTDRGDISLSDITIPASHDAGLSKGHFYPYHMTSPRKHCICQEGDIESQLAAGSRFFDLRIEKKGNNLHTLHGEGLGRLGGAHGQQAGEIFEQIDDFLSTNNKEIVILRITHTEEKHKVHTLISQKLRDRLYRTRNTQNIAHTKLSHLQGKAIAIFDKKALKEANSQEGLHRLTKVTAGGKIEGGLGLCGEYAGGGAGMRSMARFAIERGNDHGTHSRNDRGWHDHLFMVYWQLTYDVEHKALAKANESRDDLVVIDKDAGPHYNLDYLLNTHKGIDTTPVCNDKGKDPLKSNARKGKRQKHRPNIINLDFVNESVCNKVIAFNNYFLQLLG